MTVSAPDRQRQRLVIVAASLGAVFEWYDFYLYGSLAIVFSRTFFPAGNETAGLLASLATFGVGFAVRPLGALVFGRLGDRAGRKRTFMATLLIMGASTAGVGVLPGFATLGWAAPILLVVLRMAQGLALGGEFGGASVYIAEHTVASERGARTSWIQTTAPLGFLLATMITLSARAAMTPAQFLAWGWRIPFLVSVPLLLASLVLRARLAESPIFLRMQAAGTLSRAPLRDMLTDRMTARSMLIALFAVTMPLGVTSAQASLAALVFLGGPMKLDPQTVYLTMSIALIVTMPVYVLAGWVSDRIGRRKVILAGTILALVVCVPAVRSLGALANPKLIAFSRQVTVTVASDTCRFHLFVTADTPLSDCDRARDFLLKAGVSFDTVMGESGLGTVVQIGGARLTGFDPVACERALEAAGYAPHADPADIHVVGIIIALAALFACTGIISGPVSALLCELFPARIRYSAVSLPYHIGNGIFGGFLPLVTTALGVATGHLFGGLWYPMVALAVGVPAGLLFLPETRSLGGDAAAASPAASTPMTRIGS